MKWSIGMGKNCVMDKKGTIDGVEYLFEGLLGNVLTSNEKGVHQEKQRDILGVTFYAFRVYARGIFGKLKPREIHWIPLDKEKRDVDWICRFGAYMFHVPWSGVSMPDFE